MTCFAQTPPANKLRASSTSLLKQTDGFDRFSLVRFNGLLLLAWGLIPRWLQSGAEQRRIVEKIDRLMGMCDLLTQRYANDWRSRLPTARYAIESGKGKQTDLLNALMSQV